MDVLPMPYLTRIVLYPIKSLDGVAVQRAKIAPGGALVGDREFAIADPSGRWINGKRVPKIMGIRAEFDLPQRQVVLRSEQTSTVGFHLDHEREGLEAWFSDYFDQPVHLVQNQDTGFPDDQVSPGPTLVTVASLKTVASWYPDLDLNTIRRRFRTNLEVSGTAPFWEDQLFGEADQTVAFRIGEAECLGINPCQRCPVPTRDPETGKPYPGFQKIFVAQRQVTLPEGVLRSRFNHFYRFTVNTRIPTSETGKSVHIGDPITMGA